jgi:ribulose-phosphate 3-epimerase
MPRGDWIRTVQVEPSLYGADLARLGAQVETLLGAGCRVFHFDVGDGHFVEAITMGPLVLQAIAPLVHGDGGVLDVHLLVEDPARYVDAAAAAGADSVTFHFEAVDDVDGTIRAVHGQGLLAGVAFDRETEPEAVAGVAGAADLVLCSGVQRVPSGHSLPEETVERVERLRAALERPTPIQVDGNVGPENIDRLRAAGASLFVAASAIFAQEDPAEAYRGLVHALS